MTEEASRHAPTHRGEPPPAPDLTSHQMSWGDVPDFVRRRSREILAARPWKLLVRTAIAVGLLVIGLVDRDPTSIGPGASFLLYVAIWFFLGPLLGDVLARLGHALTWGRRRR